jgi:SPP1 family predicted phage head-tail adaptor
MDRSDVIKLISVTTAQDDYGIWQKTETAKQVFCRVSSISQTEFFDAGRNGLNPEYRFIVFFGDYENEMIVEYKGQRYAVYRTYQRNDDMELYVERKGGTNGIEEDNSGPTG